MLEAVLIAAGTALAAKLIDMWAERRKRRKTRKKKTPETKGEAT